MDHSKDKESKLPKNEDSPKEGPDRHEDTGDESVNETGDGSLGTNRFWEAISQEEVDKALQEANDRYRHVMEEFRSFLDVLNAKDSKNIQVSPSRLWKTKPRLTALETSRYKSCSKPKPKPPVPVAKDHTEENARPSCPFHNVAEETFNKIEKQTVSSLSFESEKPPLLLNVGGVSGNETVGEALPGTTDTPVIVRGVRRLQPSSSRTVCPRVKTMKSPPMERQTYQSQASIGKRKAMDDDIYVEAERTEKTIKIVLNATEEPIFEPVMNFQENVNVEQLSDDCPPEPSSTDVRKARKKWDLCHDPDQIFSPIIFTKCSKNRKKGQRSETMDTSAVGYDTGSSTELSSPDVEEEYPDEFVFNHDDDRLRAISSDFLRILENSSKPKIKKEANSFVECASIQNETGDSTEGLAIAPPLHSVGERWLHSFHIQEAEVSTETKIAAKETRPQEYDYDLLASVNDTASNLAKLHLENNQEDGTIAKYHFNELQASTDTASTSQNFPDDKVDGIIKDSLSFDEYHFNSEEERQSGQNSADINNKTISINLASSELLLEDVLGNCTEEEDPIVPNQANIQNKSKSRHSVNQSSFGSDSADDAEEERSLDVAGDYSEVVIIDDVINSSDSVENLKSHSSTDNDINSGVVEDDTSGLQEQQIKTLGWGDVFDSNDTENAMNASYRLPSEAIPHVDPENMIHFYSLPDFSEARYDANFFNRARNAKRKDGLDESLTAGEALNNSFDKDDDKDPGKNNFAMQDSRDRISCYPTGQWLENARKYDCRFWNTPQQADSSKPTFAGTTLTTARSNSISESLDDDINSMKVEIGSSGTSNDDSDRLLLNNLPEDIPDAVVEYGDVCVKLPNLSRSYDESWCPDSPLTEAGSCCNLEESTSTHDVQSMLSYEGTDDVAVDYENLNSVKGDLNQVKLGIDLPNFPSTISHFSGQSNAIVVGESSGSDESKFSHGQDLDCEGSSPTKKINIFISYGNSEPINIDEFESLEESYMVDEFADGLQEKNEEEKVDEETGNCCHLEVHKCTNNNSKNAKPNEGSEFGTEPIPEEVFFQDPDTQQQEHCSPSISNAFENDQNDEMI